MTPELQVASSIVRSDGRLRRHSREERVAERCARHELRTEALLHDLAQGWAVLLEEVLVRFLASLDVVHPFPCTVVQGMLSMLLRVVILVFTIHLSKLPVLLLNGRYIALKIACKAKVFRLVVGLRIEAWEEEQAGSGAMECSRPQHLACQKLRHLVALRRCHDDVINIINN